MPSTVERFFQVLSEIVPNYKEYLNPPCDPSLFVEIENKLCEELPAAFKEFYSIADGETLNLALCWRFMSLSEIIDAYNLMANSFSSEEDFYYYSDEGIMYNGNKVKTFIIFHRKWLPIINGLDTDYLLLDFVPADEGTKGQIILINSAGDLNLWYDYASSFENFIQLLTDLMIENKPKYADSNELFGNVDIDLMGRNAYILPIDDIQIEKFNNLPFEWKEYFKTIFFTFEQRLVDSNWKTVYYYDEVTLKKLSEICELKWFFIIKNTENEGWRNGFMDEEVKKCLLQDITPLILMPRMKEFRFSFEINLSQLDFVSKYLTQIYKISIPNVFQQEDLKIISKFKRLFELQLNCGKIDDFSDLLSCKDLARLTLNSNENLSLTALSELRELRDLNICSCSNIGNFSAFSAFKSKLTIEMTREQFLKAHTYMDKNKIKPFLTVPYGVVEQPATAEEQIIINEWFGQ